MAETKIRSYLNVKPFKAKTKTGQNFNGLRLSVNRLGGTTTGIGKSIQSMYTLLKFQNDFLKETHTYAIETDKQRVKDKKKLKSNLKVEEKKNSQKAKRDAAAKLAVDDGKKQAGEVENKKKELKPLKSFLEKIAGFFETVVTAFLIFGGLDFIAKNSDKIVKVVKLFVAIGKFVYNLTKIGVFAVMDGLTNMFGDHSAKGIKENGVKRKMRFMFGFIQFAGGMLALRYITGPWRILTDINYLIGAFRGVEEGQQMVAEQEARMKDGYFDTSTGKYISKEEYEVMQKAARRKGQGSLDAFNQRIKPNSTMGGIKNGMVRRGSNAVKGLGGRISGKLGGPGGVLAAAGSVAGGFSRIAAGDQEGEEKGTAVGAGVGKAVGGIAGAAAGTALLGPFLGPFAPMVGGMIGDFLGEFIGGQIGPLIEPIFGPIQRWFSMSMEVIKSVFDPILQEIGPFFEAFFGVLGNLVGFIVKCLSPIMKFVGLVLGGAIKIIFKTLSFTFNLIKNIVAFMINPIGFAWNVIRGGDPGKDVDLGQVASQKAANQPPNTEQFAQGGQVTVPDLVPPKMAMGGALGMFGMANPMRTFDMVGQGLIGAMSAGISMFGFVADDVKRFISSDLGRLGSEFGQGQSPGGGGSPMGTLTRPSDAGRADPTALDQKKGEKYAKTASILGGPGGMMELLRKAIKAAGGTTGDNGGGTQSNNAGTMGADNGGGGMTPSVTSGDFDEKFAAVLGNYEGLRLKAYADANYGWEIPTIGIGATYYPSGFRLSGKVKRGDVITEEEAYWIKAKHIVEHRQRLLNELGEPDLYNQVPNKVKVALESVVFNYGSMGATLTQLVKAAIDSRDYSEVSAYYRNTLAKHNGGINSWRRNDEAGIIDTGTSKRTKISFAEKGGVIKGVPYINQRALPHDGQRSGDAQCYSATMGMLSQYLVGEKAADYTKKRIDFGASIQAHVQAKTLDYYGIKASLDPAANMAKVKSQLDKGIPTPVGFKYSGSGHWGLAVGYDKNNMFISDPFGQLGKGGFFTKSNSSAPPDDGPGKYWKMPNDIYLHHQPEGNAYMWNVTSHNPDKKLSDATGIGDSSSTSGSADGSTDSSTATAKPDTLANRTKSLAEALKMFAKSMGQAKATPEVDSTAERPSVTPIPAKPLQSESVKAQLKEEAQAINKAAQQRKDFDQRRMMSSGAVRLVQVPINTGGSGGSGGSKVQQVFTPTTPGIHR